MFIDYHNKEFKYKLWDLKKKKIIRRGDVDFYEQ